MKRYRTHILSLLATGLICLAAVPARAQWVPERTDRMVNDYSGVLESTPREALERGLRGFSDSTSNQVVVIITPTLYGDDESVTAQRIGQAWGVGQKEFDNGVVILIKSKTAEENWGAVAIATGYGVEGVLPDVFCKHIIDDEMIPALSDGDYERAIKQALDVILPVMAGEYSYAQYRADERRKGLIALGVLVAIMVLIVVCVVLYAKKHPDQFRGGGGGTYLGGSPRGGFGGWGGGSFGGSSWGGFGGGSFGGGGASGRF